MTEADNHM